MMAAVTAFLPVQCRPIRKISHLLQDGDCKRSRTFVMKMVLKIELYIDGSCNGSVSPIYKVTAVENVELQIHTWNFNVCHNLYIIQLIMSMFLYCKCTRFNRKGLR